MSIDQTGAMMARPESRRTEQIFWVKADIAEALEISQTTLNRIWKDDDSFPRPVKLRGHGGQLRWFKSEVLDWVYTARDRAAA